MPVPSWHRSSPPGPSQYGGGVRSVPRQEVLPAREPDSPWWLPWAGRKFRKTLHRVPVLSCHVLSLPSCRSLEEPASDPPVKTSGGSRDHGHTPQACLSSALFLPPLHLSHKISNRHWTLERLVGMLSVSWSRQPQSSESQNPRTWEGPGRGQAPTRRPLPSSLASPGPLGKGNESGSDRSGDLSQTWEEAVGRLKLGRLPSRMRRH